MGRDKDKRDGLFSVPDDRSMNRKTWNSDWTENTHYSHYCESSQTLRESYGVSTLGDTQNPTKQCVWQPL